MAALPTYLVPVTQLLFFIVLAIVWLVGFIRQRNFGFLLLALATFAEGALSVARQAILNVYLVQSTDVSALQRAQTIGLITMGTLGVNIFLWIIAILGALLIVLQRPKVAPAHPPVS
jgi:hypothetical protein